MDRAIDVVLAEGKGVAQEITPVVSGSMRAAWETERTRLMGVLGIDPQAVNTVTGVLVSKYAPTVGERHNILDRIVTSVRPLMGVSIQYE
jgi:hypothetical protein